MTQFTVRAATVSDVTDLTEIERLCFTDPWSEASFSAQLKSSCVFTVAENTDGSLLGFSVVSLLPPEAELLNIAVLPRYRGTGVSDALLSHSLEKAKDVGVQTVYLEVRSSNERAQRFYKRFGFCPIGVRKNYYKYPTEDAILMSLDI